MTTYKGVVGTGILSYAGDIPNALEGQVWFNSTAKDFRVLLVNPGSWATGGALNQARQRVGGAGTQTAAIAYGGDGGPAGEVNSTELYNGTAWTEVNNLNNGRAGLAGAGTQTAAIAFGGYAPPGDSDETEIWNGTNWTEVNDMNVSYADRMGFGTNTAAIATGGQPPIAALTEVWNGTNWTEVNDLNAARYQGSASGKLYFAKK